jgi:hypothetical protein
MFSEVEQDQIGRVESGKELTMQRPVFDESVGIDWDGCDLVERVPGKVSGVLCGRHEGSLQT